MPGPVPTILPLSALDTYALQRKLSQLRLRAASLRSATPASTCMNWSASVDAGLPIRAAIVAATAGEVATRAAMLETELGGLRSTAVRARPGAVAARADAISTIGILFPGQASPASGDLGPLRDHVPELADLYRAIGLPPGTPPKELTQLAIVAASLAALRALDSFGLEPSFALGHSLGELLALYWANAYDRATLLRLARIRGEAMTAERIPPGAMAALHADEEEVRMLAADDGVVIACANAPKQYVVSGKEQAVEALIRKARAHRVPAKRLKVTGAFHSPLMKAAAQAFAQRAKPLSIGRVHRPVISTVTGGWIGPDENVREILTRQIESPVRFSEAVAAASRADILIEAGPGRVLTHLVPAITATPVFSLATDGDETDLRETVAALWACGALTKSPPTLAPHLTSSTA